MRPWTLKEWFLELWKKGLLPEQQQAKPLPVARRKVAAKAKSIAARRRAPANARGIGALAASPSPWRIIADLIWGDGVGIWHIALALSAAMGGTFRQADAPIPFPAVAPPPPSRPSEFERYMARAKRRSLELTAGKSSALFAMLDLRIQGHDFPHGEYWNPEIVDMISPHLSRWLNGYFYPTPSAAHLAIRKEIKRYEVGLTNSTPTARSTKSCRSSRRRRSVGMTSKSPFSRPCQRTPPPETKTAAATSGKR